MSARIRFWSSMALAALLSFGFAASAHALTTLVSPNVSAAPGDSVVCRIVNAGTKAITVKFRFVDFAGVDQLVDNFTVPPGGIRAAFLSQETDAHCLVTGVFSKGRVRASIEIHSGGRIIVTAPAD